MKPGLYHKIISGKQETKQNITSSPAHDAALAQAKLDWLASPVTSDIFKTISSEIEDLESQARRIAVSYKQEEIHKIVGLLIRADALRNILEKHAR